MQCLRGQQMKEVKMTKAIISGAILTYGFAIFPTWGDGQATVRQAVHDGDTVLVAADGNLSVRFLGIDTPGISFMYPDIGDPRAGRFISTHYFEDYLSNPFSESFTDSEQFRSALGAELVQYLESRLRPRCATNHWEQAKKAEDELEDLIQRDVLEHQQQGREYRFFMAFAHEVMDGYGRLLCYLHRDDLASERADRQSYNESMLELGWASPYFIWPNINPFRTKSSLTEAVPAPRQFKDWVDNDPSLSRARNYVRQARETKIGLFVEPSPLMLEAFELRYLARRKPPHRYVLDMSMADGRLLAPLSYHKIENSEDRLFIPEHFVPLFEEAGYRVEKPKPGRR